MHILDQRSPTQKRRNGKLLNLAGVVQVGLFNNMCDVVVLASSDGVSVLEKGD